MTRFWWWLMKKYGRFWIWIDPEDKGPILLDHIDGWLMNRWWAAKDRKGRT